MVAFIGPYAGGQVSAQPSQPAQPVDLDALTWPRFYATNGYEFAIYQPQISDWPGNQLSGRFVVAVRPAGTSNETYGVVFFQARTEIDKVNRLVTLEEFQMTRLDFPTQKKMQPQYRALLESFQRHAVKVIPLDHLEAVFAASADITKAKIQAVKNDPPRVIYTTQPSLLILVDGAPILKPLVGDYQRVVNTRAILLLNTNSLYPGYYLFAGSRWHTAPSLEGPWAITYTPPPDTVAALDAALATKQVDPMYPKNGEVPAVLHIYVSTVPTELVETTGAPNLLAVSGTDLLYVENTSNAIFYYLDDGQYYVLISGRWFKSASLNGPYAFVPAGQLPADFKNIPADHEKSNVLASVPGTPQSQEAVIANSIPQTATIKRDQAKLTVDYFGAPSFTPITGTKLSYAANTATPVVMVNANTYYACEGGVWFKATAATGPWVVATSVPGVVYTIPASCPIHYVTYAYVYGFTPTVVYVGYTPGYAGTVVAPGGVVVYGTGYYYPPVIIGTSYVCYPPTYGYGASMAMGAAVGFAFGYCVGHSSSCCCEPYWGCYHWATPYGYSYTHVNVNSTSFYTHWGTSVHATGSYGYNPYTGNEWASRSASTYNPYTGTRGAVSGSATYNPYTGNAAASRSGSWYNPYSGANANASSSANASRSSGNYNANRQASGYNPTTGSSFNGSASISGNAYNGNYNANRQGSYNNAATGESISAQKSVSGNAYNGTASVSSSGTAQNSKTGNSASWNNGTMTSDKNGNTYTYNQGQTSQNKSTAQSENAATKSSPSSWNKPPGSSSWADRESSAQSLGSQRFNSWRSSGGGGWGGFHGGGGGWRR